MARHTKEEAQATRGKLLDAAECLFQLQGVSRTSLQDIAVRAGTTRGAVYWHFKDKADLFNAMMARIELPLEGFFNQASAPSEPPRSRPDATEQPLQHISQAILSALSQIINDPQTRRVLEVATHKVEYVEEHKTIRLRHLAVREGFLARMTQSITAAAEKEKVVLPLPPAMAALGLHALIDGLAQNWLLDPQAFDLLQAAESSLVIYLTGLGFRGLALPPQSNPPVL